MRASLRRWLGIAAHLAARRGGLHVFQVLGHELGAAAAGPGAACRALLEEELLDACGDAELGLSAPMVRGALRRGDVCVGALAGGELAGYAWYAYGPAPHVRGVWVRPPDDAIYRYKSFVRPAFRGCGIASSLYRAGDAIVARPGRRYVVNCVAVQNAASIAASRRSGDALLGVAAYWQAGRRFLALRSAGVGSFGLRFLLREGA
jgi:ribosomal protein S18 acetylase RimI-like enzyme